MKKQRKNVLAALLVTAVMAAGLAFSACAERSDNLEDLVSSVRNMGAPEAERLLSLSIILCKKLKRDDSKNVILYILMSH